MQPVEFRKMFFTPLWKFKYPDFDRDAEFLVNYLTLDHHYITNREQNGLQITRANLHKDPQLKRLADFFVDCGKTAMSDMGYLPSCGITSMWATRQRAGGFHHQHHHVNSFLGGAFHLFDVDNCASGTVFANTDNSKYVIQPAVDPSQELMLKHAEHVPFSPGHLLMFPAWASHLTRPTSSRYRVVVATNIMPIGMTNKDHFDRYNYPDTSDMVLKEYQG